MARTRHKGKLWVLRMMLRQGYQVRPWAFNEKRCRGLCCKYQGRPRLGVVDHLRYEQDATDSTPV